MVFVKRRLHQNASVMLVSIFDAADCENSNPSLEFLASEANADLFGEEAAQILESAHSPVTAAFAAAAP